MKTRVQRHDTSGSSRSSRPPRTSRSRLSRRRAAVLLEVVLALVLLAGAAAIIGAGLGASVDAVERQRLNTHAANLAASVLAEAQLGLRSSGNGPETFEAPFERWTWELNVTTMESEQGQGTALSLAEAIIRHDDPPVVHRLAQVLRIGEGRKPLEAAAP